MPRTLPRKYGPAQRHRLSGSPTHRCGEQAGAPAQGCSLGMGAGGGRRPWDQTALELSSSMELNCRDHSLTTPHPGNIWGTLEKQEPRLSLSRTYLEISSAEHFLISFISFKCTSIIFPKHNSQKVENYETK